MVGEQFYTVYRITNKTNSKSYVGCHIAKNPDDGYMGSGKIITSAIKKYGVENFDKEVLYIASNEAEMFESERALIAIYKPKYNIHEGGNGGWSYVNNEVVTREQKIEFLVKAHKVKKQLLQIPEYREKDFTTRSRTMKKVWGHPDGRQAMLNREYVSHPQTEESRRKISEANKGKTPWNKGQKQPPKICVGGCGNTTVTGRCRSCAQKMSTKKQPTKIKWPNVWELVGMVNSNGYRGTARILGVSDTSVHNYFKNLNIIPTVML